MPVTAGDRRGILGPAQYRHLLAVARRSSRWADEAEDLVQEALLEAVRLGREASDISYICGIIRNKGRMSLRGRFRRQRRDEQWRAGTDDMSMPVAGDNPGPALDTLPASLRIVATLALSGHNRREIGYLLGLSDVALRQRVSLLGRHMRRHGVSMPVGLPGLKFGLAYGRMRDALLPALIRHGGTLASHDPDGHLFVVRRSHNANRRQ